MKTKLTVIAGPTAVGKSDFAVEYALKNNGEIVSADSRQVYKGLDIGTGKITVEEMKGVTHHLLDVVNPRDQFNVEKYKILAEQAIADIVARGKLPILCGGTGFYIVAVVYDVSYPHVPHNIELREELETKNTAELFLILNKLDAVYASSLNHSEQNNTHRLIRSIELATALGKVPAIPDKDSVYDVTWIILDLPYPELKDRIRRRLAKRIEQGMIEEVQKLHDEGLSWERMEKLGLEYRYVSRYLQGLLTQEEMVEQLQNKIWHYAKSQIMWFRKYKQN